MGKNRKDELKDFTVFQQRLDIKPNAQKGRTKIYHDPRLCVSDELLFRYIEKNTSKAEKVEVELCLSLCQVCFDVFSSVLYNQQYPFTSREKAEVDELMKGVPPIRMKDILARLKQDKKKPQQRRGQPGGRRPASVKPLRTPKKPNLLTRFFRALQFWK